MLTYEPPRFLLTDPVMLFFHLLFSRFGRKRPGIHWTCQAGACPISINLKAVLWEFDTPVYGTGNPLWLPCGASPARHAQSQIRYPRKI
jgi:hypothetical protein